MGQFSFSLSDVKKQLGPGLGIRSNLYLLEVATIGSMSKKLAVLCMATSLPERTIGTVDLYHKGRRYKVRGETDLTSTFTINITDDSEMKLRQLFDNWMKEVDNTTPPRTNALSGIFGEQANDFLNTANGILTAVNEIKSAWEFDKGVSWFKNMLLGKPLPAGYQSYVNIWQLSKTRDKIYGYQLTNAYPVTLGAIETDDSNENALSQFSVDFAYSDFHPIKDEGVIKQVVDAIIGDEGNTLINNLETLFD